MRRSSATPSFRLALDFHGRAHGVDDALKGGDGSVAGALDDAAPTPSDGGIEEVTPQCSEPRKRAFLVGASEARIADDVGDENRCELADFRHQGSGNS